MSKKPPRVERRSETYYEAKYRLAGGEWTWAGGSFVVTPADKRGCPICICRGCDAMATQTTPLEEGWGRSVDHACYVRRDAQRRPAEESPYKAPQGVRPA